MRNFFLGILFATNVAFADSYNYDPCLKNVGEFHSVPLEEDAPSAAKNDKGVWNSDSRSFLAHDSESTCEVNDIAAVSISSFCSSESKMVKKILIPKARIGAVPKKGSAVSVDVSKADFDWLLNHGMLHEDDNFGQIPFYATCE